MEVLRFSRGPQPPAPDVREAGFSLVELLVALVILAFVALSVFGALDYGMALNGSSRDYTTITNIAKSRLEQIVALPYTAPQLVAGTVYTEVTPDGLFEIDYQVRNFNVSGGVGNADPAVVFAGAPVVGETPGTHTVKIVTLTASARGVAPGVRSVTVEAVKHVR
jgi:prepilin-type N-terminal cleavage/methylation domain-containing protein